MAYEFPTALEKVLDSPPICCLMPNSILRSRGRLAGSQNLGELLRTMKSLRGLISEVDSQLKDADLAIFVCVCIAELLSFYETERLTSHHIDMVGGRGETEREVSQVCSMLYGPRQPPGPLASFEAILVVSPTASSPRLFVDGASAIIL